MKKLSIIIVYYNTPNELLDLYDSISNQLHGVEVIIIDNNSTETLPKIVLEDSRIKIIINSQNKGFGRALNQGAKAASGEFLLFLNPDTILPPRFIYKILKKMNSDEKIGLMGVRYSDERGRGIRSVGGFPTMKSTIFSFSILNRLLPENRSSEDYWMNNFDYTKEAEVPVVGGACMIVRREAFILVKGFDKQFFMYFEEADLSQRIRDSGYKVLYYPKITITHLVGRSSNDTKWIRKNFEESRYKIIKKYEGLLSAILSEFIIRYITYTNIALLTILAISLFLNLYRIDTLMMFYGDFGRDYLVARDMILTGQIPLRGIPSSVVWLHQGPLSIYLIALALKIGNFNPVTPAIFYAILGVFSTLLTYFAGKEYFSRNIGLIAALLYATSPLIVINARMPYHTAPIPFFTLIFFLILIRVIKGNNKVIPYLAFVAGLLFLLELSNFVIIIISIVALVFYRVKIKRLDLVKAIIGFVAGILPFIIYDLFNRFTQTGGFILWVLNRIRLFVTPGTKSSTSGNLPEAVNILWRELCRLIFPQSQLLVFILLLVLLICLVIGYKNFIKKSNYSTVIIFWLAVSIIAFLVHARPGVAYTPVIFPAVTILLANSMYTIIRINKIFVLLMFSMILVNVFSTIQNNYYLATAFSKWPDIVIYNYGLDYSLRLQAAQAIVKDAKGEQFSVSGGGYLNKFSTSVDNYKYIIWHQGGNISELGSLQYRIYENKKEIKNSKHIIFQNKYIAVTKNE